jgi:hypothetical protein
MSKYRRKAIPTLLLAWVLICTCHAQADERKGKPPVRTAPTSTSSKTRVPASVCSSPPAGCGKVNA